MKKYFITYLLLLPFLASFAQQQYTYTEPGLLFEFSPKEQSHFEICDLEIGKEYIYSFSFERGTKPFEIKKLNNHPFQHEYTFIAKSECKSFEIEVGEKVENSQLLVVEFREEVVRDPQRMNDFDVTPSNNPVAIISDIFQNNKCFEIIESSIEFTGDIGTFENGEIIGSSEGIIMSTGNPEYAEGPNNTTGNRPTGGGQDVDADLRALSGGFRPYDVTTIEFDFIPTGGFMFFQYIFASDEYCDYVNSEFNDVFGFFLSGPGINGNFTNNAINLATVNLNDPVSINTINWQTNFNQYISNVPMFQNQDDFGCTLAERIAPPVAQDEFQFDGFTRLLTAQSQVQPCEVYHLKLAIADISDDGFDSAVFFRARSFFAGGDAILGAEANGSTDELVVYENCGRQELTLQIDRGPESLLDESLFFGLDVGGTATVFEDYSFFVPFHEIPASQESFEIPISIVSDDIPEGTETIEITLSTACTCELPVIEIEIREVEPIEVELQASPVCEGSNVVITATVTGGAPEYEYRWNNGFTESSIEVDPQSRDFFSIRVEDGCGSRVRDTIFLDVLDAPSAMLLSGDEVLCDESDFANLDIEIDGVGPFQLVIQNPSGGLDTILTSDSILTLPYSEEGDYSLVSLEGLCPGEVDGIASIMVNDLSINVIGEDALCNQAQDGSLNLTITGGQDPFDIIWADGSNDVTRENLMAGLYEVTVTDDNGCESISSLEISEPTELMAQANPQGISTCLNPMAGLVNIDAFGGTPPYIYDWNTGDSLASVSGLEAGIYLITVTDQNACSQIVDAEILSDNSLPDAMAEPLAELNCTNSSINIIIDGSSTGPEFTYTWTNEAGQIIPSNADASLTVSEAGFYTLTVSNTSNGCDAPFIVEVNENFSEPTADNNIPDLLNCINNSVELALTNLSENTQVTFASALGSPIVNNSATSVNVSDPGSYTATLTNTETGCQSIVNFDVIQDLTPPQIDLAVPDVLTCEQTSFLYQGLDENTDYEYEWYFDNTLISESAMLDIIQTGTYSVVVTNSLTGCTSMEDLVVAENTLEPRLTLTAPDDFGCSDVSLNISSAIISGGSSGFSYQWTTIDGNIISGQDLDNLTIGSEGEYVLTITDLSNGCTSMESVSVAANTDKPIIEINPFEMLTCTSNQVTLDASNSSQGSEFSIEWQTNTNTTVDNNSLIQTVENPGEYTLIITNEANGCSSEQIFTVEQDLSSPEINLLEPQVLGCNNVVSAIMVEEDNSDYTYEWSASTNGNIISSTSSANIEVDQAGIYQVLVTNNLTGCTETFETEVIADDEAPIINAGDNFVIDCNQDQYFLNGTIDIDAPNASISWSTMNGNIVGANDILNPQISTGGTYILTVVNLSNGCDTEQEIIIDENIAAPEFILPQPDMLTCAIQEVSILAENFDANLELDFEWSHNGQTLNGESDSSLDIDQPGEYTLLITNSETGCTSMQSISIGQNIELPMANAGFDQQLSCNVDLLTLDGAGSVGSEFEYNWVTDNGVILTGENTLNPVIEASGEYTLIVTNNINGCSSESSLTISPNTEAPVVTADQPAVLTCDLLQTNISAQIDNVSGSFTFTWAGPNNFINNQDLSLTVEDPGLYIISVLNEDNGCETNFSVEVIQDLEAPEILIAELEDLTCTTNSIQINSDLIDPASLFEYEWTTQDGSISSDPSGANIEVSSPGTYTVNLINLATGCTNTQEISVQENIAPPVFSLTSENVIDCNNPLSFITINTQSNVGLESEWQIPLSSDLEFIEINDTQVSVNQAGIYTLIFTNLENGCTASQDIEVVDNFVSPIVDENTPEFLNCENENTQLTVNNPQSMNLAFEWFDAIQNSLPGTSNEIIVDNAGDYTVLITNLDNGCTEEIAFQVQESFVQPIAEILGDKLLTCEIQSLNLQASDIDTGNSYTWLDTNGNVISNFAEIDITAAGNYTLIVTNLISECVSEDNFSVDQTVEVPDFELTQPLILDCRNTTASIMAVSTDTDIEYTISTQQGNITTISGDTFEVDQPGIYTVVATNVLTSCDNTLEIEVFQDTEAPEVDAGPGFELTCTETIFQLLGSTNLNDNFTLQWISDNADNIIQGSNTLNPTVAGPGLYELIITNEINGCSTSDDVAVSLLEDVPNEILLNVQDPPCAGDPGAIDIFQINGGQGPYLYSLDNGANFSDFGLFENLEPGVYDVRIQDQNGCELDTQVEIPDTPEVFADLPPEIELEFGENGFIQTVTNIDPADIASISWSPAVQLSCESCLNPQVTGLDNQLYTVTIVNINGCVAEASIQLRVDRDLAVYIPNAFSPNNLDGINDVFMIFAKENIVQNINSFQVYDRWGTEVFIQENFMPNDPIHGWDGSFRGEKMNTGVFVYWAEIEFIDGSTQLFKGDVTLTD